MRSGWRWLRGFYRDLIADLDLSAAEKRDWRADSIPYSLAETSAQFLGARSHRKARESSLWRRFDDWACSD